MKGWIKLTDCREPSHPVYVEAESVYLVQHDYEGPREATIVNGMFYARESADEVMRLMEEARGKSLYKKMVEMHRECKHQFEKYEDCTSRCPYHTSNDAGLCIFCDTLPSDWVLEKIPEEYR